MNQISLHVQVYSRNAFSIYPEEVIVKTWMNNLGKTTRKIRVGETFMEKEIWRDSLLLSRDTILL